MVEQSLYFLVNVFTVSKTNDDWVYWELQNWNVFWTCPMIVSVEKVLLEICKTVSFISLPSIIINSIKT